MDTKKPGLTGTGLKIIACIAMFIDHFAASVLETILNSEVGTTHGHFASLYNLYDLMRIIGRIAFPIFCFLIAEGFMHTHNKWKYLRNLCIFSFISEIPFNLAVAGSRLLNPHSQNVFFTLTLGVAALCLIEEVGKHYFEKTILRVLPFIGGFIGGCFFAFLYSRSFLAEVIAIYAHDAHLPQTFVSNSAVFVACIFAIIYILRQSRYDWNLRIHGSIDLFIAGVACLLADCLSTDYGAFGVFVILLVYMLKRRKVKNTTAVLIVCLVLTILTPFEFFSLFSLIPVFFYNGERGGSGQPFAKYCFYAFYPVHLLIFYLISLIV